MVRMAAIITAALDAMGGDMGAAVVVPGADIALGRHSDIRFRVFGDEQVVRPLLDRYPRMKQAAELVHTDIAVRMDDRPSQALRRGRWESRTRLAHQPA